MELICSLRGVTLRDRIKSEGLRNRWRVYEIVQEVQNYQFKWMQRVLRTPPNRLSRKLLKYKPHGRRDLRRPHRWWTDQFLQSQNGQRYPNCQWEEEEATLLDRSPDWVVYIETWLRPGRPRNLSSTSHSSKRLFFFQTVHTGCWAYPPPTVRVARSTYPAVQRQSRDADHPLLLVTGLTIRESTPPLHHTPSWCPHGQLCLLSSPVCIQLVAHFICHLFS
jgi:hypothetical protein